MRHPLSIFLVLVLLLDSCGPIVSIENPFSSSSDHPSPSGRLKILIVDVGQGDSTIVIGPTGRVLLIDAGPAGSGASFVLPALERREIDRLDWIVASHYDSDHIGGLPEILQGHDGVSETEDDYVPTHAFLDRGEETDKDTPAFRDYVAAVGDRREEALPGLTIDLGARATATVIVANGRYADGASIHLNPDEENEASLGLLIRYGEFSYFTAGDLTGGGDPGGYETKDLESHAAEIIGDINVLHIGHHGSASSSNSVFLQALHPEAAVISVGRDNDYGHPALPVLQRLDSVGTEVYRTDLLGNLEVISDGKGFEIKTF